MALLLLWDSPTLRASFLQQRGGALIIQRQQRQHAREVAARKTLSRTLPMAYARRRFSYLWNGSIYLNAGCRFAIARERFMVELGRMVALRLYSVRLIQAAIRRYNPHVEYKKGIVDGAVYSCHDSPIIQRMLARMLSRPGKDRFL